MILVDERRLEHGAEPASAHDQVLSPAALLERVVGLRTLRDGERRALVRRIAAENDALGIAEHVRRSPSFASHALAAFDRGDAGVFAALARRYASVRALASVVDVTEAMRHALAGATLAAPATTLAIDDALLVDERDAFAWRRLAALAGFELVPCDLGPPEPPPLDLVAIAAYTAFLRYAASGSDGDARAALRSKLAPIDPDDARTLLAVASDRADVLDVIESGAAGGGREFAHALRTIARAYHVPNAGAADVLAAAARVLTLERATEAALARISRDFDGARVAAPSWEARELLDEIAAELADAAERVPTFAAAPPACVVPEAPVPVTSKRTIFSASSLNAFAECERKWYFRYTCAAVEDRGSSASFYGIAFHRALEDFHREHRRFDGVDAVALEAFLDACIVGAFDRQRTRFDAPVEFELQKRRARRTAKRYLAWLLERARHAPFEVVGCEVPTEVRLGEFPFVGFIDRLDRSIRDGTITVVDYKTGAIAKRASEYLDEVLAFAEFQLPFYYWARTQSGDRVTRLALVPLKDAWLDVAPVELTVVTQPRSGRQNGDVTRGTIAVGDLERARDRMIELAALLSTPTIARYAAATDPSACRYCAYANACRERPPVVEDRFSR